MWLFGRGGFAALALLLGSQDGPGAPRTFDILKSARAGESSVTNEQETGSTKYEGVERVEEKQGRRKKKPQNRRGAVSLGAAQAWLPPCQGQRP